MYTGNLNKHFPSEYYLSVTLESPALSLRFLVAMLLVWVSIFYFIDIIYLTLTVTETQLPPVFHLTSTTSLWRIHAHQAIVPLLFSLPSSVDNKRNYSPRKVDFRVGNQYPECEKQRNNSPPLPTTHNLFFLLPSRPWDIIALTMRRARSGIESRD